MSESEEVDLDAKIKDGYEVRIWISEEDLDKVDVDDVFFKLEEFFSDNWDVHGPDEPCVIGWNMSGGPTYTTQREINEFNEWLASLPDDEDDDEA